MRHRSVRSPPFWPSGKYELQAPPRPRRDFVGFRVAMTLKP
jgi:hypothetical protein